MFGFLMFLNRKAIVDVVITYNSEEALKKKRVKLNMKLFFFH